MASLKELQSRIKSVKNTQKITKAKQMVAAAKLRKAQEAAERSRPYSNRIGSIIINLASSMDGAEGAPELLVGNGKDETVLLVVATAERGLCGGFNTNIVRAAREEIIALERAGKNVKLFLIGKKGQDQLARLYGEKVVHYITLKEERNIHAGIAQGIGEKITAMFEAGDFDVAKFIYSKFENIMTQEPTVTTLIPAIANIGQNSEGEGSASDSVFAPDMKGASYTYEPDEEGILRVLLPRNINTQIFSGLLENVAGEQAASMTAMDNATRNAGDMIDGLTLKFNRTRQAQITSELIEIISGAEAL